MRPTTSFTAVSPNCRMVLVVERDPAVLRDLHELLAGRGLEMVVVESMTSALERIARTSFDAVIADDALAGSAEDGLAMVVHAYQPTAVFVTMSAEDGFMVGDRPIARDELADVVRRTAARTATTKALPRVAVRTASISGITTKEDIVFARALDSLDVVLEPIVDPRDRAVTGYDVRFAPREAAYPTRDALAAAAVRLERERDLRRRVRSLVAEAAARVPDALLFLDVSASELSDPELAAEEGVLSPFADRIVLQLRSGCASADLDALAGRWSGLRFLGFKLAVADFEGEGELVSQLAVLCPDFVKLHAELVRGIDKSPTSARRLGALLCACAAFGARAVAEGVGTVEERDVLLGAGCTLAEGALYVRLSRSSRPMRPSAYPLVRTHACNVEYLHDTRYASRRASA